MVIPECVGCIRTECLLLLRSSQHLSLLQPLLKFLLSSLFLVQLRLQFVQLYIASLFCLELCASLLLQNLVLLILQYILQRLQLLNLLLKLLMNQLPLVEIPLMLMHRWV